MSNDLTLLGESPFDAIRREDERGEYWTGRELMVLMGYMNWREFKDVIERAKAAAVNSGAQVDVLFGDVPKKSTGGRPAEDVRLTRLASYLVAQNGDPRKPEVAEAQTYFAVRTRQAETARPMLSAVPDLSGLSAEGLAWLGQIGQALTATATELASARKELARAQTKVEYVDNFVKADEGASLLRVFANQIGEPEQELRDYLLDHGVIYNTPFERWSGRKQALDTVNWYHPYAAYRSWFTERDQPKAPRTPDGRMMTTLDITPVGKTAVRRMLLRHPIRGAS